LHKTIDASVILQPNDIHYCCILSVILFTSITLDEPGTSTFSSASEPKITMLRGIMSFPSLTIPSIRFFCKWPQSLSRCPLFAFCDAASSFYSSCRHIHAHALAHVHVQEYIFETRWWTVPPPIRPLSRSSPQCLPRYRKNPKATASKEESSY